MINAAFEQLDLSALWYQMPLAAYLLLFAAAWLLASNTARRWRYVVAAGTIALSLSLLYYNGLLNTPGLIVAAIVFFVPCAIAGACLAFAFVLFRRGRSLFAVLALCAAAAAVAVMGVYVRGLSGLLGNYYYGWGLCLLPPIVGGLLMARSVAMRRRHRAQYLALGLLFAGTVGLAAYMNLMEGITYAFVAPERMFGPYAKVRVTEATIEAIVATFIYVAGSLLLLALPFGLDKHRGRVQGEALVELERIKQTVRRDETHRPLQTRHVGPRALLIATTLWRQSAYVAL